MKIYLNTCIRVCVMSHRCCCRDQLELKNNIQHWLRKSWQCNHNLCISEIIKKLYFCSLSIFFLVWASNQTTFLPFFYYSTSIVDRNVPYCILLRHKHLSHFFIRKQGKSLRMTIFIVLCHFQSTVLKRGRVELYQNCYVHIVLSRFFSRYSRKFVSITLSSFIYCSASSQ